MSAWLTDPVLPRWAFLFFCAISAFAGWVWGFVRGRCSPRTVGEAIDLAKAKGSIPEFFFCAEENYCVNRVEIRGSRCKSCLGRLQ